MPNACLYAKSVHVPMHTCSTVWPTVLAGVADATAAVRVLDASGCAARVLDVRGCAVQVLDARG